MCLCNLFVCVQCAVGYVVLGYVVLWGVLSCGACRLWGMSSWGISSWGISSLGHVVSGHVVSWGISSQEAYCLWGILSRGISSWGISSWGMSSWGMSSDHPICYMLSLPVLIGSYFWLLAPCHLVSYFITCVDGRVVGWKDGWVAGWLLKEWGIRLSPAQISLASYSALDGLFPYLSGLVVWRVGGWLGGSC